MSTEPRTRKQFTLSLAIGLPTTAVLIVVGLLLNEHGPGNMGTGLLIGGAIGLLGAVVLWWRVIRRRGSATTFERAWTQTGDERDDTVLTHALAVLGLLALPLTGAAAIAIAFEAAVDMVLALLLFAEIMVGVVAFAVASRRN